MTHARDSFTERRAAARRGRVLADLGAEVDFFCALGRDENGRNAEAQLKRRGINVHAAWRTEPTRRVITMLVAGGERTIVTIGERLEPLGGDQLDWDRLRDSDGVYFTAGDPGAADRARLANVFVASPGPATRSIPVRM